MPQIGPNVGTDSELNQKVWRPGVTHETEVQTISMGFVGPEDDNPVVLLEDLTKKRGDTIQYNFSPTYDPSIDDDAEGVTHLFGENDEPLGDEDGIDTYTDTVKIGHIKTAWRVGGPMSQQRIGFDQKKQVFIKATKVWSRYWDMCMWHQLAAYTPAMGAAQDDYRLTGNNVVTAIDTDHHFFCSEDHSTDETLDSTDLISLNYLDNILLRATSKSYIDYPMAPDAEGFYHLIIHPKSWRTLRQNTTAGDWEDLQRATIEGGKAYERTGIYGTWMGVYSGIKIHVSDKIPYGVNSSAPQTAVTAVRRNLFLGANGGVLAFGEGWADGDHLDWSEMKAGHNSWSVQVDSVFGCKATIFNGQYYGSMVVSAYEA